jgi:hypothetical protein
MVLVDQENPLAAILAARGAARIGQSAGGGA